MLFPLGFPTKISYKFLISTTHLILFELITLIPVVHVKKHLIMQSSPDSCHFLQIFSSAYGSQIPSIYALPLMWETKFHTHTKQVKLVLYILIFKLLVRRQKTKDTEQNGSKHSSNLICC
jgi:hypothetical protein